MSSYVSGRDRPMYFKRPLVPAITDVPVHLSQIPQEQTQVKITKEEEKLELKTKDQEVQTVFRESEAQTDPYTPEYRVKQDEKPEVLSLQNLKWKSGLPASIDELDQIEQNREKILFENALPPISDEASFILRKKLMEFEEFREWSKKENNIKKQHHEQLYLLQSALIEREKEVEEKNASRIEEIKIKKTEQKNRLIAKIQRKKIKVLRKMLKGRKSEDNQNSKREIIEDYADFGSRVYAGITREGLSLDHIANKYEVQPIALTSYKGIKDLSDGIPQNKLTTKIDVQKIQKQIDKSYTRRENAHKSELKKAQEEITGQQKKVQQEDNKEQRKYSLSKIKVRPPTPLWFQDQEQNLVEKVEPFENFIQKTNDTAQKIERDKAVILLQRLLRGRAMQNIMYEGKEKRLALIDELLTVANIPNLLEEDAEEILMQNHEEKVKNAVLESIQGEVISETFDALSKELLRMNQEKKIAKMVKIAENDRKQREIQEAGKRQAEQTLRNREDVLYNQIMRLHQGTVDTYLDWITNNTIDRAATRQAVIMTNLRKEKMNKPIETYERQYNKNETIIKDLVQQFLIPNVQRSKLQKQIQIEEKRFSEAAKSSLSQTITKASDQIKQQKKDK